MCTGFGLGRQSPTGPALLPVSLQLSSETICPPARRDGSQQALQALGVPQQVAGRLLQTAARPQSRRKAAGRRAQHPPDSEGPLNAARGSQPH